MGEEEPLWAPSQAPSRVSTPVHPPTRPSTTQPIAFPSHPRNTSFPITNGRDRLSSIGFSKQDKLTLSPRPSSPPLRVENLASAAVPFRHLHPSTPPPPPNPQELVKHAAGVVKSRNGAVLSRGFIIKSDFRPPAQAATALDHDALGGVHLRGAANFRMAELGVFGVAQPTETGLRTVLSVLKSQPVPPSDPGGKPGLGNEVVWFCTREEPVLFIGEQPFVLRDAAAPTKTYAISDRAENLEEIEARLKTDVIREAARYGGVVLVQEEFGDREIRNTWVAADSVRTIREVFEDVKAAGYNVTYHRVPVTRDQSPEDRYLDRYAAILATIPSSASLVFNCGVGVVRTTFAMCAALLIRRRQLMAAGAEDPYAVLKEGEQRPQNAKLANVLRARSEQAIRDQSLLRLMNVLQQGMATKGQHNILSLLTARPQLLENLRTALLGNYDLVLSLLSTLDDGNEQKKLVDCIVDHCDALVNLRESVLEHRIRYASSALLDDEGSRDHRSKALAALERYFFLISFASYAQESAPSFDQKFSSWLKNRSEISKMISRLRKSGHFYVFSPVHDLSAIARVGELSVSSSVAKGRFEDVERTGGEVIGDEWASQIVRTRSGIILRAGMILKNDQWRAAAEGQASTVRGAMNFRRVPGTSLYGLSQPTEDGIDRVLEALQGPLDRVVWINLREEPLLYINGTPYVLRQEAVSLRNVKSYAGISSSRLELLEERLKGDVLAELRNFDGRLLLHSETEDGSVVPSWEIIEDESSIKTLREVMDAAGAKVALGESFEYRRVPVTPSKSPDFNDVKDIFAIVASLDLDRSAVLVNCQLGRGRSTRALVLITLVQRWLRDSGFEATPTSGQEMKRSTRYSYTVIQNLLRTIRSGQTVKNAVDDAVTQCGEPFDLLDAIEESREAAEDAKAAGDKARQKAMTQRGILNLRAYFFLILFTSFLMESRAETWRDLRETGSYEAFVKNRPVFKTIERELDAADLTALTPLEKPLLIGSANQDEVKDYVAHRSGQILSAYTLLKSDFFSGLQKMSLPERVEGAPNFRRVRLLFGDAPPTPSSLAAADTTPVVFGSGMPTIAGLRRALERMGAKTRRILWTSLREEPVIYVSGGRPHVLRLFDAPLENVITTGVTTDIVEGMERSLKRDILREAAANDGKVLLNDEIEEADGSFKVTATWEETKPEDVLTPAEVFAMMNREGFDVDYERLPVTDEQAPLPEIFSRIEHRVASALEQNPNELGFAFSCQMGRGRTTTGMVAAALVTNILHRSATLFELSSSTVDSDDPSSNLTWDGREADPLLQGEYKLILQLVGVMQFGKLAKRLTDKAIDAMEGVQNLRKAIYDFKLRVDAADINSKKYRKLLEQALNYLYRYGALIIFANYLLEKSALAYDDEDEDEEDDMTVVRAPKTLPPFTTWLEERRELKHLLRRKSLD